VIIVLVKGREAALGVSLQKPRKNKKEQEEALLTHGCALNFNVSGTILKKFPIMGSKVIKGDDLISPT
jgi:hypothetical protein